MADLAGWLTRGASNSFRVWRQPLPSMGSTYSGVVTMTRLETDTLVATKKPEANAMSAVDAYSPEEAIHFASKMFKRRCEGWGDETQALEEVSGWCGMTPRSFKRLMKGDFKDLGLRTYRKVRGAYLDFNQRLLAQIQHEIRALEEIHGHAPVADIATSLEAIEAQIRAEKAAIKANSGRSSTKR